VCENPINNTLHTLGTNQCFKISFVEILTINNMNFTSSTRQFVCVCVCEYNEYIHTNVKKGRLIYLKLN